LDAKHIFKFLKYANYDLSDLENRVQYLSNEITNLEGQKRNSMNKVILWNAQLSDLSKAIDHKNQQLNRMDK
jgi:chromosome segregation ATPase